MSPAPPSAGHALLPAGPGRWYRSPMKCALYGCSNPLCSTLLRAISHMSVELSFHTCAATQYSSTSGSRV